MRTRCVETNIFSATYYVDIGLYLPRGKKIAAFCLAARLQSIVRAACCYSVDS